MAVPDSYIAAIVSAMFTTGVVLAILKVRQRSKTRRQWKGGPPTPVKKY